MARVEGLEKVSAAINRLRKKYPSEPVSVCVCAVQRYALYVHENMQAKHPVGQAKFLETPARRDAKELGEMVKTAVKNGASILMGLKIAGLELMRRAQLLTPVDTSALKSSYFVVAEEGLEAKSEEMFQKSEEIRRTRPSRWDRTRRRAKRQ